MSNLNETHNPKLQSWIESANVKGADFPIQNLPFAVFRSIGSNDVFHVGVAIGDQILDLNKLQTTELFTGQIAESLLACSTESLNAFMAMGNSAWAELRLTLSRALRKDAKKQSTIAACLFAQSDAEYKVAADIGDYTDFYTSIHHAENIGRLFRPDNPLLPNYQWVPIAYHGRSSSIVMSGTNFHRPCGQTKAHDANEPSFGPSKRLDYELEVGIFIGEGNALGESISIDKAEDHVFGLCLFNDWSARDIQAWEYQPLGPFLSKNFFSTVSPWVVTLEALLPYRSSWTRPKDHPQPLDYLESDNNRESGNFDIQLEVLIETEKHRSTNAEASSIAVSNFDYSYWTVAQMIAHHTVNGCNLKPGDFFGSGTMSGPQSGSEAALIESTKGGKEPIKLNNGETRTFLEDGDNVIMRGRCQREGLATIGFGEVSSMILPAKA